VGFVPDANVRLRASQKSHTAGSQTVGEAACESKSRRRYALPGWSKVWTKVQLVSKQPGWSNGNEAELSRPGVFSLARSLSAP
jgi:hypothetical protein